MALTDFTTYSDIRAIVGLTSDELPDSDLDLESFIFGLQFELKSVGATLEADYMDAMIAVQQATATVAQTDFYRATKLFSTTYVGLTVAYSLPMRAQKSITDGKAGVTRFSDSPYKETLNNLQTLTAAAKAAMSEKYSILKGIVTRRTLATFMLAVRPSTDPVTG